MLFVEPVITLDDNRNINTVGCNALRRRPKTAGPRKCSQSLSGHDLHAGRLSMNDSQSAALAEPLSRHEILLSTVRIVELFVSRLGFAFLHPSMTVVGAVLSTHESKKDRSISGIKPERP
jgi:hypothetical protein